MCAAASANYNVVGNPTLNFSFLQDNATISYLRKSKVLLILRGLSGSGKSYIANIVKQVYGKFCVICSADSYFMKNGSYCFQYSKLKDAHQFCKKRAQEACRKGINVVVIDNTNVHLYEMDFYIELAHSMGYVHLIIEPLTIWNFHIEQLKTKTTHGLSFSQLKKMCKQWEKVYPVYFGWFLNERDSLMLKEEVLSVFDDCMINISVFKRHMNSCNITDLDSFFNMDFGESILHCTSKYAGSNQQAATEYAEKAHVKKAYGQVSRIKIVGIFITPRTIGARIKLSNEQLLLWDGNKDVKRCNIKIPKARQNYHSQKYSVQDKEIPETCIATMYKYKDRKQQFPPTPSHLHSAHITLGCKTGIPPHQSNIDLVRIMDQELKCDQISIFSVCGGKIRRYNDMWMIYFDKFILADALFSSYISESDF